MRISRQLNDLSLETKPVVLAVGSFDGVHRGHQVILRTAADKARAAGGEAWALTFDPHPAKVLRPDKAPPLLTSTAHKLRLIEEFGLDGCIVMPFSRELASQEPGAFLDGLVKDVPNLVEVVVGANWTFGHRAKGNSELLRALAPTKGFAATVIESVLWKGEAISSTQIRRAVSHGDFAKAEEMLGRPFSILGTVVHGKQIGTQMGFPTANLDPHNEVRPPSGVYAARVAIGSRTVGGAAFLAAAPDAKDSPSGFIVEVHLLDFDADIYGRDIEMFFVKWIRDVEKFASRRLLQEQIARDVEQVREILQGGA